MAELLRTPLYETHRSLGARLVPFAGWSMPVQYSGGILAEHHAVRKSAGVFDVSHMGEIELSGPGAEETASRLFTNTVSNLPVGMACYTLACLPGGGIVDDLIVYRQETSRFLVVANASNVAKDEQWLREQSSSRTEVVNRSDEFALLAVQGPDAIAKVASLWEGSTLTQVPSFGFAEGRAAGVPVMAARTGYTGEDGFELFVAPKDAPKVFSALIEAGVTPCGLGSRDTLRLEAKLCLYGQDIDETTSPLEAGLGVFVSLDKDFIGKEALVVQKQLGVPRRLVGLVMKERGIARHGYAIYDPEGPDEQAERLGEITSGSPSPSTGQNIALGYVPKGHAKAGQVLKVDIRQKRLTAAVHQGAFYKPPYKRGKS